MADFSDASGDEDNEDGDAYVECTPFTNRDGTDSFIGGHDPQTWRQDKYINVGHCMIVIDPKKAGNADYAAQISAALAAVRNSPPAPGETAVSLPGAVGAQVRVLPNHACFTAAAYPGYRLIEAGALGGAWTRVNGW